MHIALDAFIRATVATIAYQSLSWYFDHSRPWYYLPLFAVTYFVVTYALLRYEKRRK